MNMLKLEHINTGYGKRQVLFDISFEMKKGETILLTGSNGSGKSTLLKTIYGLLKPWDERGRIWFNNEKIITCKPFQLIVKGMVYIPQQNELFEDLIVKENLEISGMHNINKEELENKIDATLERIPVLKKLLKLKCSQISGGERKLLSFAMALINQPKLIMFDEPLSGVSPGYTDEVIAHLEKLKNTGITLVIVEQKVKSIFKLADHVIGLKAGRLFGGNILTLADTKRVMI